MIPPALLEQDVEVAPPSKHHGCTHREETVGVGHTRPWRAYGRVVEAIGGVSIHCRVPLARRGGEIHKIVLGLHGLASKCQQIWRIW